MAKQAALLCCRLAAYRLAAGLTQQELAAAADVSRQTIVAIERGDYAPSTVLALRLALLLAVPVAELFSLPEPEIAAWVERRQRLLQQPPQRGEGGEQ